MVVDVRDATKFKDGHIAQAINLPMEQLNERIAKLNKHKNKPIIVVCPNGNLSVRAAATLRKNEFAEVYILEGGLIAWNKENLPLVKD